MGVPKFYKWLSERYPLLNQVCNSEVRPEFDNLYLDMNGIIHNCTHSDSPEEGARTKSLSQEQMLTNIFKYLEKLFLIAQPKKLLYMAIDGVAPRAKMNQQRQRRFRSAKDARDNMEAMRARGEEVNSNDVFDSNCITPGTQFMNELSDHIRYFIRKKMKEDAAWQKVKVIFSGAEVPGEGEHKIMLYIRNMKSQSDYDPNLRHVLYGLDADLIMLSLASHDPHFSLLREEVVFGNASLPRKVLKKQDEFQFLHISLLREYLDLEFSTYLKAANAAPLKFAYDLERIIDDWVILAFLVGNDFLPHLPTLDIGEGGLDTLFQIYREELPNMDGYILENKQIVWERMERILGRMGQLEESVFAERQAQAIEFARKQAKRERRAPVLEIRADERFEGEPTPSPSPDAAVIAASLEEEEEKKAAEDAKPKVFDSQLKMLMKGKGHVTAGGDIELDEDGNPLDYEQMNFKSRYYREKFPEFFDNSVALLRESSGTQRKSANSSENIRELVRNYAQGLQWVASYYYEGCRSWKWFFEYRYAPLASDMVNISQLDLSVQLGYPFRPMEQLLGVLPPASGKFLPAAYRALMDPRTSSVADFYPQDFSIDMNGKRSAWEGIALIPFIDESRLLKALANISQSQLTSSEQKRNERYGKEYLIQHDPDCKENYPSTCSAFPMLVECQSREVIWKVPSIPMTADEKRARAVYEAETAERAKADPSVLPVPVYYSGNFQPKLCVGVRIPMDGYPSITSSCASNNNNLSASLQKIAVNVFGMESRKDSLVLRVAGSSTWGNGPALAKKLLNQHVFVDWPYLKDGLVTGLTDATHIWSSSGGRQMTQGEAATHRTECVNAQVKSLQSKAVDVGTVTVLAQVQFFIGMKRSTTGAIKRAYAEEAVTVPLQLLFAHMSNPDPRYAELPPPSLQDAFPIGQKVVYTGPQNYGAIGSIIAHNVANKTVSVKLTTQPAESSFGRNIATSSALQYYPSYLVSKSLQIHPLVLSKICSSVYLQQERTDIGLKIKFAKQSMQVPEYARRVDAWNASDKGDKNNEAPQQGANEGWEYSEKAVALLAAYKRCFPLLFEMMNEEPNTFKYDGSRLIQPSPAEKKGDLSNPVPEKTASDAINEIANWLKTVGISNLLLIPCSSQLMAERGVKAVEQEASRLAALRDAVAPQEVTLSDVPIYHLYRPDPVVAWSPTETELPSLGDRVMSIRSDSGAPFGLRGTVVCVHTNRFVEIVFDREFMSGTHLNHKCSNLRGQTLPCNAILDLSKPKVLAPKNAPAAKPAVAVTSSSSAAPAPAQKPVVPAAATAAVADVDAASNALKQMLQIGGAPASAPVSAPVAAPVAASAAPVAAAPVDPNADPMERMLQKSKASKSKPAASATGIVVGPPVTSQYVYPQPPIYGGGPMQHPYPPMGPPPMGFPPGPFPPQMMPPPGAYPPPMPQPHIVPPPAVQPGSQPPQQAAASSSPEKQGKKGPKNNNNNKEKKEKKEKKEQSDKQ